jgi:hypothetical protein
LIYKDYLHVGKTPKIGAIPTRVRAGLFAVSRSRDGKDTSGQASEDPHPYKNLDDEHALQSRISRGELKEIEVDLDWDTRDIQSQTQKAGIESA